MRSDDMSSLLAGVVMVWGNLRRAYMPCKLSKPSKEALILEDTLQSTVCLQGWLAETFPS